MLARGSLGNPWLFEQVLGARDRRADARRGPRRARLGDRPRRRAPRARSAAARYLRKVYPWYLERLARAEGVQAALQQAAVARRGARDARCAALRRGLRRWPPAAAALLRARADRASLYCRGCSARPRRGLDSASCPRTSSSPPKVSPSSRPSSSTCRPTAAARSPRGSRRRASSATSPRTPSTTTPRTSRRCSRRGSPSSRSKLRSATVIDAGELGTDVVAGRLGRPRQGREDRQVDEVHDRRLGRGQPGARPSSPTSRRSARRCSAASAATSVVGRRSRAAERASSRSPRSTSG